MSEEVVVQTMTVGPVADPLKSERVQEKLRAAPAWRIFSGGRGAQAPWPP